MCVARKLCICTATVVLSIIVVVEFFTSGTIEIHFVLNAAAATFSAVCVETAIGFATAVAGTVIVIHYVCATAAVVFFVLADRAFLAHQLVIVVLFVLCWQRSDHLLLYYVVNLMYVAEPFSLL